MINYSTVHLATSRVITYCITITFVNKCPKVDKLAGYTIISIEYDPTTTVHTVVHRTSKGPCGSSLNTAVHMHK